MTDIDRVIDFYESLSDDEKRRNQLQFIENIYPSIDKRLKDLKLEVEMLKNNVINIDRNRYEQQQYFYQYKGKIQRIEQFIIDHGLIRALGKKVEE